MHVSTIIARNYLPAARVLGRSLTEHHPDLRLQVLVIDDYAGDPSGEPFDVVDRSELDLEDYERMAGRYTVIEFSTAVKPWLLQALLRRPGADGAIYLDPDMRLYAPIDDVLEAVRSHEVVLNPHNIKPMPRDGRKPTEQDILIAGVYNLGFCGVRAGEGADFLLDWWCERLETDCIVEPERGFFVDQRWIDFVPGIVSDLHLVRDEGFNVAYWNLATRELGKDGDRYTVNGGALRLFHFSGFKADKPHSLSSYQDRIRLADDPVLAELCAGYARELIEAGYERDSKQPYGWMRTASGMELGERLRRQYREATDDGVPGSPFEPEGERAFVEWLNEPDGPGAQFGITRFLQRVWEWRGDLRIVYPDLSTPADAEGFLGWTRVFGVHEVPIPRELAVPALEDDDTALIDGPSPRQGLPVGVNVAGYFRAELGVGEVARQVISALDSHGVPVLPVSLHAPLSRAGHAFAAQRHARPAFDVNLICVNADGLPAFAAEAGDAFFEGRHNIGFWWWELSRFPEKFSGAFEYIDEIWAGSRFVVEALSAAAPVPVVHIPTPVAEPAHAAPHRKRFGMGDAFWFLFAYDYNSVFERKNPLPVVEAFHRAFPEGDEPVGLILKSINHERDPLNHDRVRLAARGDGRIRILDGYLSSADKDTLTASADAYVSLHRSEGFGIGMAEALLRGKPVIATAYGGNTDFLTDRTGYPVTYELREVGPDAWPYPPDSEWAEPDVDAAAAAMRRVFEHPDEGREKADAGARLLRERHSARASGEHMVRRLKGIGSFRAGREVAETEATRPLPQPQTRKVVRRLEQGPVPTAGSKMHRLARPARKAVLRAMKPYTTFGGLVDRELAEAVETTDRNLRDAVARAQMDMAVTQAELLAELRRLRDRLAAIDHEQSIAGADGRTLARSDELAELDTRVGDLVGQVDRLRLELSQVRSAYGALVGDTAEGRDPAVSLAGYPQAPDEPWTETYTARHRDFVARELDDAALLDVVRAGRPLPDGFGVGFDERVIEFPWIAAQRLSGDVLDAGSTLNHAHVIARLRPRMDDLHVVTLAPEEQAFTHLGISYLYADLRELPLRDECYDRVLCISTLEHVGADNAHFGAPSAAARDRQQEALRAMRELRRVTRTGGDLYLTLPVGAPEQFTWARTLSADEVDELMEAYGPSAAIVAYYRYDESGWQPAGRDDIADRRYHDHLSADGPAADRAPAARAVACVHLVR